MVMDYVSYRLEKILLVAVYSDVVFNGKVVRQEPLQCCNMNIDPVENAMWVFFREIVVGGKVITLLEPLCPVCGKRVAARYSILN